MMPVKGNHKVLQKKIACLFASPELFAAEFSCAVEREVNHGRVEVRRLTVCSSLPAKYLRFPHVCQVYRIERQVIVKKTGELREETEYGMTSLGSGAASASRLLALVRGHWTIENRSHYVRDVTFGEDVCRVRRGNLPQVLSALRNACVSLVRLSGKANVAAARRYFASHPKAALRTMGIPITE
jgi:predicted transposase YbfD/YdcC